MTLVTVNDCCRLRVEATATVRSQEKLQKWHYSAESVESIMETWMEALR